MLFCCSPSPVKSQFFCSFISLLISFVLPHSLVAGHFVFFLLLSFLAFPSFTSFFSFFVSLPCSLSLLFFLPLPLCFWFSLLSFCFFVSFSPLFFLSFFLFALFSVFLFALFLFGRSFSFSFSDSSLFLLFLYWISLDLFLSFFVCCWLWLPISPRLPFISLTVSFFVTFLSFLPFPIIPVPLLFRSVFVCSALLSMQWWLWIASYSIDLSVCCHGSLVKNVERCLQLPFVDAWGGRGWTTKKERGEGMRRKSKSKSEPKESHGKTADLVDESLLYFWTQLHEEKRGNQNPRNATWKKKYAGALPSSFLSKVIMYSWCQSPLEAKKRSRAEAKKDPKAEDSRSEEMKAKEEEEAIWMEEKQTRLEFRRTARYCFRSVLGNRECK